MTGNDLPSTQNSTPSQTGLAAIVGIVGALFYWLYSGRKRIQ
jgi:hypothetical protein